MYKIIQSPFTIKLETTYFSYFFTLIFELIKRVKSLFFVHYRVRVWLRA